MALPVYTLTPNVSGGVAQELNDPVNGIEIGPEDPALPIVAYDEEYAESIETEGGRRVRSRPTNPVGSLSLMLSKATSNAFWTLIDELQQTVELCRRKGGTLRVVPVGGTAITYDLESISITGLPADRGFAVRFARPTLTFVSRPYGRRDPISLVSNATSSLPIQSISLPDIPGSVDALLSVTVTDTATQARDHLEYGLDDDWDGTAPLLIDSASLSVSGLAGSATTRTGAYSSSGVVRATLATVPVACCEVAGLTHRGRHNVKARLYGSGTGPIYVRVAYRIGSGPWSRNNGWKVLQGLAGFYELELGRVKANPSGTLTVRVEAYSAIAGDTLDVDYLMVMPTSKRGKARGGVDTASRPAFVALDSFDQSAGTLAGKTLRTGGTWSEAGDADAFSVNASTHQIDRTAVSDSAAHFALGGASTYTDIAVQASFLVSANAGKVGVVARYSSTTSYVSAEITFSFLAGPSFVVSMNGSAIAGSGLETALPLALNSPYVIQLFVSSSGEFLATASLAGAKLFRLGGSNAALATGGGQASGKVGLIDNRSLPTAVTRSVDDFAAWLPSFQHVTASSGATIIGHDSIARSDGTRPPSFEGRYLKCPPAGREDRTHRLAVKLRRNDVDSLPDDQIADGQRVDVTVTPRCALL